MEDLEPTMKKSLYPVFLQLLAGVLSFALAASAHAGVDIQHWQAKSGTKVLFVENHDLPMLDVAVWFDAGSRRDVPDKAGRASLVSHLMQMGAAGLSEEDIAKRLADIGAQIGAAFDRDRSGYSLRTLSSAREREGGLAILSAVLQHPDFSEAVLQREKQRLIASLKEDETKPDQIAEKAFYKAVYGEHPYALPESGELGTVAALKREDLIDFYKGHYLASRAVVVLIGDVKRAEAETIAERLTAALPDEAARAVSDEKIPAPQGQVIRVPHPATQAHILMGAPGMQRIDPDYFPLLVGNYVLGGGGFDSRILDEIRQKRGLAYSAYSYFIPYKQPGPFQIGVQTKKGDADAALKVLHETLDRFVKDGPTEAELKQAKNNIVLGFPLRIDSNRKILDFLGVIGFYDLPLSYLEDYPKAVAKVTVADVRDAFRRRVQPDSLITVIVGGPESKK
jgi:zinc protease